MSYKFKLEFYQSILDIICLAKEDLPRDVAMKAIDLFAKAKDDLSLPEEFTAKEVTELHKNFRVRADYAEAAFKDLAQHLRDPEARAVIKRFLERSGTGFDELYFHVRNVSLLGEKPNGPAVVTLIVSSYAEFHTLIGKNEELYPEVFHGSVSDRALGSVT